MMNLKIHKYVVVLGLWVSLGSLPLRVSHAQIEREIEPNDRDFDANGPLRSGRPLTATLSNDRDRDWFYLDAQAAGDIHIELDHASSDDFDWYLYRATGSAVTQGTTGRIPETNTFALARPERLFIKVQSYRGSGAYELTVTFPSGPPGPGPRPRPPRELERWIVGNADDQPHAAVGGPGLLVMGGNFDVDEAFRNRAYPIVNGGDVVVLRESGGNGYGNYLYDLAQGDLRPDSVETIVVDTRALADSDYVSWVLETAEMVFIAGGNQSAYLNLWAGTRVESAIQAAYRAGAVIGGISAGAAVQSNFIYDPDGVPGLYASEAVTDPCDRSMQIASSFLDLPLMDNLVIDTHFAQRNRLGRLMAFMARIRAPRLAPTHPRITGVGVDEDTSLFIDKNGRGIVDGDFSVYVLTEDSQTEATQVRCREPVIYRDVMRALLDAGDTYDFVTGRTTGQKRRVSIDGDRCNVDLTEDERCFYTPAFPY